MPIGAQKKGRTPASLEDAHPARPKSRFEEAIDRLAGGK
jgi:hypothetical protein